MSGVWNASPDGANWGPSYAAEVPQYVGPYGQPVMQRVPNREPTGADYAHAMLAQQYGSGVLQQANVTPYPGLVVNASQVGTAPGGVVQTSGTGTQGMSGVLTPTMTGVPGIAPPGPPGAVAALGAGVNPNAAYGSQRTEIRFVGPAAMKISWYAPKTDGTPGFTTQYLEAPARYNFVQSAIYRLKLSEIPNRPGVDLYPTIEIVPCNVKTATFLAHSAVPISFTEEDFEQVAAGNFVVKVIYLPDPQFQDLAATGPDEVVSSRLEPGVDPILEAKRRGTILAIIRLGNIDLEAPNTPAMDAPDGRVLQQIRQQQMIAAQQQMMMMQQQAAMMRMMNPSGAGLMPPGMMPPPPPGMPRPGMTPPAAPTTAAPTGAKPGTPIGMQDDGSVVPSKPARPTLLGSVLGSM
jgi:hypothetical protein